MMNLQNPTRNVTALLSRDHHIGDLGGLHLHVLLRLSLLRLFQRNRLHQRRLHQKSGRKQLWQVIAWRAKPS